MSTTVSYKGQTLTTVSNDTKTLLTEGKYLEGDLTLTDVSGGGAVLTTKNINANGTYNASSDSADGYSQVIVAVPNTYTNADEGKVVSDGALVAQTSKNINSNGTHSTVTNNQVVVAVPNSYSQSDEGKVVDNGELVAQTAHADVTPTTSDQTIDTTTNNSIKVKGDADLIATNIKKDVEIFGVTGSYEGGGGGVESVWMDAPEPTDNNLHIWIDLTEPITQKVNLALSGTGNIDWGDGATETSVSLSRAHTYAQNGVYEIVISWTGTTTIPANNQIVNYYEWEKYFYIQRHIIRRIYIPSTITAVGNNKLQNCYALDKATIKCAGTLGDYVFQNCDALREIVVGEGVTSIGTGCFMGCVSAYKVDVPATCTEINGNAFNGVRAYEFHFRATTPPTLASASVFNSTESSSKFYVPASAVTAYQEATNWSSYASRIVAEP